jgi:imidazolonepropionase-like amidohydrolase
VWPWLRGSTWWPICRASGGTNRRPFPIPSRYAISEDAGRAAAAGVIVVTTLAGLAEFASEQGDSALRPAADDLSRANLAVLRDAGVPLAMGSDMFDDTSVREALHLATLGVLTPAELLRSWSETTPRAIFPDRGIGCLVPGCEASFLVLEGDPLQDFRNLTRLRLAVKEGRRVTIP